MGAFLEHGPHKYILLQFFINSECGLAYKYLFQGYAGHLFGVKTSSTLKNECPELLCTDSSQANAEPLKNC